jgi:hypothetical protein
MGEIKKLQDYNHPKAFIPFKTIFDRHYMYKQNKYVRKPKDCIEINIGSKESPKFIKVGNNLSKREKKMIENLVSEYRDICAWTHDDIKAYKGDIIQHIIPLKKSAKPFKQKLRKINPKLAPLI